MSPTTIILFGVQVQLLFLFWGSSLVSGSDRVHAFTEMETTPNISVISPSSSKVKEDNVGYELLYKSRHHHWHSKDGTITAYDIIERLGATEFLKLTTRVQLDSILKNPNGNITVFVPTNDAMMTVAPNLSSNLSSMSMIIRFHLVKGLVQISDFKQNEMFTTLAKYGQDTAKYRLQIRTNIYKINDSEIFSASGAGMIKSDLKGNGTVVHLVNKALFPLPLESAYYTIFRHSDFSILKTLLVKSFTLIRVLSDLDRFLTFFAPTNEAFKKLSTADFNRFQNDVPLLTKTLVQHIASNTYYTIGLQANRTVKGVALNKLLLQKKQNNYFVFTNNVTGRLSIPDFSVLNGLIHGIDTVLYNPSPKSDVDIIG